MTVFSRKGIDFYKSLPGGHRHHVYNGGLLVHTIEVAEISDILCNQDDESAKYHPCQTPVNRDLCITGALLHDVGKTKEFLPYPFNSRTEQGYYVGYQTEGAGIVDRNIKRLCSANPGLDFATFRQELINMVLACHTNYKMSMPPRTKEARFVLLADQASAYRDAYDTAVCTFRQENPASEESMIYSEYFKCNIKI
jgi:3'-5' exoribonuclease